MTSDAPKFGLAYLEPGEAPAYLRKHAGKVLGVVAFGEEAALPELPCPLLTVAAPVLDGKRSSLEVWTSDEDVTVCEHMGIRGTCDGKVIFGEVSLTQRPGEALAVLAEQIYMRIFGFIDHFGCRNLLRVWQYFPQINDDENGLERYRCFNVGRHAAFIANGRSIGDEDVPAASALGSNSGALTVYFMAGKRPGSAVENPRQVSAYRYPDKFGPRSPIFVRALSVRLGGQDCFFISGTASIVGFETVHQGDVEKQTAETLLNIRTLLQQAPHYNATQGRTLLKVYLRHEQDLAMVKSRVQTEFGTACRAVYLHSNICRSDLLLEIEGVYFNDVR